MSFFFFKNKPSLSFVFDIRDSSVSLAVARFENNKKPEIVLCQNFKFKQYDRQNHQEYLSSLIKVLDVAVISTRKKLINISNNEEIGTHYFFIGSPWSASQSKTIKIIKDKPFVINNSLLEKIIVGEESSDEKFLEEQTLESNWKVLEEKIIQSKLNGYKVDEIFGKKALSLAIELFVSFVPFEVKEKISSYVDEKIGKNTKRQNNSCILSSYSFFRDLYTNRNDFIYVDIGKLITDVYVVRDDVIFGVTSIPFGEENIIQTSLSKTSLSRDIFLSHINIGQDNKFDLDSHNRGEDLLKAGFDMWKDRLKDSLVKICTETNIPNNIFIITNSIISSILIKELSNKEKSKLEILGSKIEVSPIAENIINNFVSNGNNFANEPYVKMDLVFLDKVLKQ